MAKMVLNMRCCTLAMSVLLVLGPFDTLARCNEGVYSGPQNISIEVGGHQRTFILRVPWEECGESCTGPPKENRPVILNFHGCNRHLPALSYHLEITRMNEKAADLGWYTITPVGTPIDGNYGWNTYGILCGSLGIDDVAFVEALLDYAVTKLCVNPAHIFGAGFSTGGFLLNTVGCIPRIASRFRGIGVGSGSIGRLHYDECSKSAKGAMDVISFHSKGDHTVPYNGTEIWASQDEMVELWRNRNYCGGASEITFQSATTQCTSYTQCEQGGIEHCALLEIPHCWYGGRNGGFVNCTARPGDIDATSHLLLHWSNMVKGS